MTRYFQTTNASRPYKADGFTFHFEPTAQIGGVWSGALAVEDESAASALAGAKFPQVTELTDEEFAALKKKPSQRSTSLAPLPRQPESSPSPVAAVPVVPPPASESPAEPSQLRSEVVSVPDELGFEEKK